MNNNYFRFDDIFWQQIENTAIGGSLGCTYSIIFYSFHEETSLLTSFPKLCFYKCYIDDQFRIWSDINNKQDIRTFEKEVQSFGVLYLELREIYLQSKFSRPYNINFKKSYHYFNIPNNMNLHIYLLQHTAQPPGILKSMIFDQFRNYWQQNFSILDYKKYATLLFEQL